MEIRNQSNQHSSSAKRALNTTTGEDHKRREDSIHEDTIFNPSPDDQTRHIHRPDPDQDPTRITTRPDPTTQYRECQRNHAAHMGTHVVDGCGEFLPEDSAAMVCAACGCHRNFHRKETRLSNIQIRFDPRHSVVYRPFPFRQAPAPAMDGLSEDMEVVRSSGKRCRTKFTGEQKEKMMELGEKIGWRIRKEDEGEVQRFCAATGVKRQVFKVWMHNNKQAMKRKQLGPVENGFGQDTGRT